MGRSDEWLSQYADPITRWLETSPAVDDLVDGLTVLTGVDDSARHALVQWTRNDLGAAISAAVANPAYRHAELSELLANAGVLPMFGFPTRVRSLWGSPPRDASDVGAIVADRALQIALSHYAPGSQVLHENRVHQSVGFALFEVRGGGTRPVEPLAGDLLLSRCQECQAIEVLSSDDESNRACTVCGALTQPFRVYEPLGFRTDYAPMDYRDSAERGRGVGAPELGFLKDPQWQRHRGLSFAVEPEADVFVVNDNEGRLFAMHRKGGTIVVPDAGLYQQRPSWLADLDDKAADLTGAIGYVKKTDVLVLNLDNIEVPGPMPVLDPRAVPAATPALWSFAEAVRRAASLVVLGVDPDELEIGLQSVGSPMPGVQTRLVFLADTLENGAGYATHLGSSATMIQAVLDAIEAMEWASSASHASECAESCPRCLRSYDNRYLHAMLDWRLALDLVDLASGRELDARRWLMRGFEDADRFAGAFVEAGLATVNPLLPLPVLVNEAVRKAAFFGHPLWMSDPAFFTAEQQSAFDELRRDGYDEIRAFDIRELRIPGGPVFAWLRS
jgi:DEAD/DEAH box helicase domain-containing protein